MICPFCTRSQRLDRIVEFTTSHILELSFFQVAQFREREDQTQQAFHTKTLIKYAVVLISLFFYSQHSALSLFF